MKSPSDGHSPARSRDLWTGPLERAARFFMAKINVPDGFRLVQSTQPLGEPSQEQINLLGKICYLRVRYIGYRTDEGATVVLVDKEGKPTEPEQYYYVPVAAMVPGRDVQGEL